MLLIVLCAVVALGRLLFFTVQFARLSLQMDFAAYYTAGEAVDRGLDPYVNQVAADPPLWDGVARYTHSRFLYPPLAAYLFVPLARLPYLWAKSLWALSELLCTGVSLVITAWVIGFERITRAGWMLIGTATAFFHPLLTHLERGQIDCLTLMLLTLSVALMIKRGRWGRKAGMIGDVGAGLLLAVATLLKLHIGLILPFLLLRRRFSVSAAYGVGLGLVVVTSLLVAPGLSVDYVTHQLPRISVYGEGGTEAMLLAPESLDRLLTGVPEEMTRLASSRPADDRIYLREYFSFFANGTLVREVAPAAARLGLSLSISELSIGLFLLGFGLFCVWQWLNRGIYHRRDDVDRHQVEPVTAEFLYWVLALTIILMTAPATWVMNLVWLLPLFVILSAEGHRVIEQAPARLSAAAIIVVWLGGLLLAAVPDRIVGLWRAFVFRIPEWLLYPWGWLWASRKYLVAEGLLLISIAAYVTIVLGVATVERQQTPGSKNTKSAVESALFISRETPE